MTTIVVSVILAALGSSGLFAFVQFLINRRDEQRKAETRKAISRIEDKLLEVERGSVRTQMLILMNHYPNETSRIMMLAERYFCNLRGDWYLTGLFNTWLTENKIGRPEWFKGETE